MPVDWNHRLKVASSVARVIALSTEFVAQFTSAQLRALPLVCRPGSFRTARDVRDYAFVVVENHCEGGPGATLLVHRLATFFSSASIRLSQFTVQRRRASQVS